MGNGIALGIAVESPQRAAPERRKVERGTACGLEEGKRSLRGGCEDLERKARPKGERPKIILNGGFAPDISYFNRR